MSQKTKIISIKHSGAPVYLGDDSYTSNPYRIMDWLCDGYRTRFNQYRSTRKKYGKTKNQLVPIGKSVTDITSKQARKSYDFLAAIPSMILNSTEKIENTEWFSAVKRRKTLQEQGVKDLGAMPRFKSKKKHDQKFTCWFNNGANAIFRKTGKNTGVVIISGKNPPGKKKNPKSKQSWKIAIRIKTTQEVKSYTSIHVNWTKKSLVFTNLPVVKDKHLSQQSDGVIGIDRGGVVPMADSDGNRHVSDEKLIAKYEKKHKFYQRKMGKARARAKKLDKLKGTGDKRQKQVISGRNYQENKAKSAKYSGKISRYRYSWSHEITTEIVRENSTIILEDLKVKHMTKKGGRKKKGMNRSFLSSSLASLASMLEYKSLSRGSRLVFIPPYYTSQRCSSCGYTHKSNRESQSVFVCKDCGFCHNADTNAAQNIKAYYLKLLQGTDLPAYQRSDMNGSGEVIRPTMPQGMEDQFFRGKSQRSYRSKSLL